jgi:hypothetical protein
MARPVFAVRERRTGILHEARWWEVLRNGVVIDRYDSEGFARAYVDYMNRTQNVKFA